MGALTRRRAGIAAIVLVTIATDGATQGVSSNLFAELSRYMGAAVRFLSNAILGIERVEASQIPPNDRPQALEELHRISRQLSRLTWANGMVISQLSGYTQGVRTRGPDAKRDEMSWRDVLEEFDAVSEIIKVTLNTVDGNKWLGVALTVEDRLTLRETLFARDDLISRFKKLPYPRTPAELAQIDRMTGDYQKLLQSVRGMNRAITGLTDRLAAAE